MRKSGLARGHDRLDLFPHVMSRQSHPWGGLIIPVSNLTVEIVGGAVGGLIVVIVPALMGWFRSRYGVFEIRFLDPDESVTAEHMRQKPRME